MKNRNYPDNSITDERYDTEEGAVGFADSYSPI